MQTRAQAALTADGEAAEALRELLGELLRYPEPLRHVAEIIQGSDVAYPMPGGGARPHPLLGKLAPDLLVEASDGAVRVAELVRAARGLLLDFTAGSVVAGATPAGPGRVSVLAARCLTRPARADALLIRPDGYVAWAAGPDAEASGRADGLHEALRAWF